MGCTAREKQIKSTRRVQPAFRLELQPETSNNHNPSLRHAHLHQDNLPSSSTDDENNWDYCSEDQLEEILMNNLEFLYKEAVTKVVELGYQEDDAKKAILTNGHGYYGGMDALANIVHNAVAYLKGKDSGDDTGQAFTTFRQLEDYSLAGMICMTQQAKPNLSRGEAMWCLLMSDLHVGKASSMETQQGKGNDDEPETNPPSETHETTTENNFVIPPPPSFHDEQGSGNGGTSAINKIFYEDECPNRFNLPPPLASLLKRNVALFAAGYRANSENPETQTTPPSFHEPEETQEPFTTMFGKFRGLSIDHDSGLTEEDQKKSIQTSLYLQAKDLEKQLRDRKAWAHDKAIQAARKLSNDLTELKLLRLERDESLRMKKGKQTLEDATMKRLSEMENALRRASGQVDRANAAVRRLETENAEIRAEMEASKLSASESSSTCVEVAKREKKWAKKLAAWDKQKTKMEDELGSERENIKAMAIALEELERQGKEAERKWKEEVETKEKVLREVEEERRRKDAAEVAGKQTVEAMRVKKEMEFQKYRDDVERLEQEIARLRSWEAKGEGGRGVAVVAAADVVESCDRECLVCGKDDVEVVFLPCAHQVVCVGCADGFGPLGNAACPFCATVIESKIRVFGARP